MTEPPIHGPAPAPAARPSRAELLRQRELLIAHLQNMPAEMRDRPQWLLWRYVQKPGAAKPAKMPYYLNGQLRGWPMGRPRDGKGTEAQPQVDQGHPLDREALAGFDAVVARLRSSQAWDGVGFAFLPGDGLIGIDIDHAIDVNSGEISDLCRSVVDQCASYTEASPSGAGVHIIVSGETTTFKDDLIGLEVYCGAQYFTCTGARWAELPAEVRPIEPAVLEHLRALVGESKARQAEAKRQQAEDEQLARLAAKGQQRAPARAPAPAGQGGDDFKRVNALALERLQAWVPMMLPKARAWQTGYRITSKDLGRELQEDLQFMPEGIMDFGEERGYSAIDAVLKWHGGIHKPLDALAWLAAQVGMVLESARRPAHAPRGDSPADERPGPLQPGIEAEGVVPLKKHPAPPAKGKGGGKGSKAAEGEGGSEPRRGKRTDAFWAKVRMLEKRYALVYSTDSAWDRDQMKLVRVPTMRLAWGTDPVKFWLASADREMISPEDLVFEPGEDVQPPRINMFDGLALKPQPCTSDDVKPLLELLRHLCSESATPGDDVDDIMHWVLRWQALPTQRLGAKMATALVFHGAQGTGKNLYFDAWRDLFGDYGITVGQAQIEEKYNSWISRKLAIIGDEVVSRQEMYHNKNTLKLVVTQHKKFPIRAMQQDVRFESNHANVVFLSNESQPLALEERDRRYMVVYTPLEADEALYQSVRDFLAAGGLAKWLHYLQSYPLEEFTEHTKPLMTQAKQDLIEAAWRAPERFGFEWLEGYLELPVRVCSGDQLFRAFVFWAQRNGEKYMPDKASFTRILRRWVTERVKRDPATGKLDQPRLVYKVVQLKPDPSSARVADRIWLPRGTGPLPGVTEGEFAADAVKTFEDDLRRFTRRRGAVDEGEGDAR